MIDIPRNEYTVESDPDVDKIIEWIVERLVRIGKDYVYVEHDSFDNTTINERECKTSEAIALRAASSMKAAGYFAAIYHNPVNGYFNWLQISKRPISGNYCVTVL